MTEENNVDNVEYIADAVLDEVVDDGWEQCLHNDGVNFCSKAKENGDQCSHCALCGTEM